MAVDIAKKDISDILTTMYRKFDIIDAHWLDDKHFETKFRTQIPRDSEDFNALCDEWVDIFSERTNTVWVKKISNTGPKIRFRKQYQCWTHEGAVQKELLFDARRCKATLDMKVLTDNPLTRRKNKHIRMGLNVVVKINFNHLHSVDISKNFSFFVHTCEPLPEPPKPIIQPNERLPQLVAEMVQKGPITSQKAAERAEEALKKQYDIIKTSHSENTDPIQIQVTEVETQSAIQIIQNLPVHNMDGIKLELQPQMQPYAQVVVSNVGGSQLITSEVSDQFLMCQPLLFDTSQVIPITNITTHSIQPQFIQVQSPNCSQTEQFL